MRNRFLTQIHRFATRRLGLTALVTAFAALTIAVNLPPEVGGRSATAGNHAQNTLESLRGVVVLREDGNVFGTILEISDKVLVIRTDDLGVITIPRSAIEDIQVFTAAGEGSPNAVYLERRRALDPNDYRGRFDLALWGVEQDLLDLARIDLSELMQARNRIEDSRLRDRIATLTQLVETRIRSRHESDARPGDGARPPADRRPSEADDLLSDEQINLIRIFELRLFDNTTTPPRPLAPRLVIPNDVLDRFFAAYQSEEAVPRGREAQAQFRRKPPHEQILLFFQLRAREFYGEIRVLDDPPAMVTWRGVHARYILNGCAAVECHGSANDDGTLRGGLRLFHTRNAADMRVAYTNFYLLDRFRNAANLEMIDRTRPDESLLVQYMLPTDMARFPHPETPGFRPRFPRNFEQNRQYQQLLNFIGNELLSPRAGYGFTFIPPWERRPAQPENDAEPAPQPTRPTPPTRPGPTPPPLN